MCDSPELRPGRQQYCLLLTIPSWAHEPWPYAAGERFNPDALIGEPYRGIRAAPGYRAQPDHTEKSTLFRLLDAGRTIGVRVTKNFAM